MVVKVYAVLGWIGAAFLVLAGLGAMIGGSLLGGMMGGYGYGMMGGLATGFAFGFGLFMLALAVLWVFVALGIWRKQEWARIVLLIFAALGVLSIFRLDIVSAAIGAVSIWLFGFEPTVTGLFGAKPFNVGGGKK